MPRPRLGALLVCLALAGVIFFAGSRAVHWAKERRVWEFDPLRLRLVDSSPDWLAPAMARAFYGSYASVAGEPFSLLEADLLRSWVERLRALPWVAQLEVEPLYPDRVRLDLELRRPQAAVADGASLRLIAADGTVLPLLAPDAVLTVDPAQRFEAAAAEAADLPPRPFDLPWLVGLAPLDTDRDAARAGAALVTEWRMEAEPLLRRLVDRGAIPRLLAVQVENHGLRLDRAVSEYSLVLRSSDRRPVRVAWGHAPGGPFPSRIAIEDKVWILSKALQRFPGLRGVVSLDARYRTDWPKRVVQRP